MASEERPIEWSRAPLSITSILSYLQTSYLQISFDCLVTIWDGKRHITITKPQTTSTASQISCR